MSETDQADARRPDNNTVMIASPLPADEVMSRVSALSTRGKLPGFVKRGERAFSATVFAEPYDRILEAEIADASGGSRIEGVVRVKRKMPTIMIAALLFTIWPGVWLTDSIIATYFHSYPKSMWVTAAWYLPMCLLVVPPLWKLWRKSREIGRGELAALIERLAEATR